MDFIKQCFRGIDIFFVLYLLGYSTFLFVSVTIGSIMLYEHKRRKNLYNLMENDPYVPVSVIVPACNERLTVIDTVKSLLAVDYTLYEIVIVDDGSTDDTAQCLIDYFQMEAIKRPIRKVISCEEEKAIYISYRHKVPITLVCKENGGKADALNMGINISAYPYFICMDADSALQVDALRNIVRPILEEKDVVACGGSIRISNEVNLEKGTVKNYKLPRNLLVGMQVIEYDRTFLASRLLFDQFNGNLIISGAFGLFKKDLVMAIGGYNPKTVGEDMELVVRLHAFCRANKVHYKIKYISDAICWSQAPKSIKDIIKQRRRWHIGLFQSIISHREIFLNPSYGLVGYLSFLYFILYELLSPYIELFGIGTIIVARYLNLINVPFMLLFFFVYMVFGMLMSLTAFFSRVHTMDINLGGDDVIKAIGLCILEGVLLRVVIFWVRLTALIGYKEKKLRWEKISREAMSGNIGV